MSPSFEHPTELLPWYVNGTLDGEERAMVEKHLKECLACRNELEEMEALHVVVQAHASASNESSPGQAGLDRLLAALESVDPEESAQTGEKVGERSRSETRLLRFPSERFRRWAPALAAAALIVLVVGMQGLLRSNSESSQGRENQRKETQVRSGETSVTIQAIGTDPCLVTEPCVLSWSIAPSSESSWDAAVYSIFVTTGKLEAVVEAFDQQGDSFRIEPESLEVHARAQKLLWRVRLTQDDGQVLESPTFVVSLSRSLEDAVD